MEIELLLHVQVVMQTELLLEKITQSNGNKKIIEQTIFGVGVASSKKEAEQIASKEALKEFNHLNEDEY